MPIRPTKKTIVAMMEIYKSFTVEAAHYLPNLPKSHKCSRLHGHSFRIKLYIVGELEDQEGWIMDFAEIDRRAKPVLNQLDHHCLNDISGLANPTSEHLAKWLWHKLKPSLPLLSRVEIQETCTTGCIYQGDI